MKHRHFIHFWFISFLLLVAGTTAFGQTAQLTGRISDQSGAVVPDAQVTATNLNTGLIRESVSNGEGHFTIPLLPPGEYRITVKKDGFKPIIQSGVTLEVAQAQRLDYTLETGAVTDTIIVTEDATRLELADASRGEVISGRTLVDMPLNGRNVFALAALVPGVITTARGQTNAFSRTSPGTTISGASLSGGQPRFNEVLLDGVPNTDSSGAIHFVPSVDAAQEFKVQTNAFDAEFGRFQGGVVNASIKSGTNNLHGSLFEFLRNSVFNARDPFATSIPQFTYNQYGGSVGGPI